MIVLEFLGLILFWAVMIAGIAVILFGIPGTFIIAGNALVYGWLTDFVEITWKFLGFLLLISILAEIVEFFLGAAAASKFGASRTGMFGAIIGGFLGAVWATPILPLLGTLLGALIGAFVGASLFEYVSSKDVQRSVRAGFGAFLGSIGGKLTKIAVAVAMVVMVGIRIV